MPLLVTTLDCTSWKQTMPLLLQPASPWALELHPVSTELLLAALWVGVPHKPPACRNTCVSLPHWDIQCSSQPWQPSLFLLQSRPTAVTLSFPVPGWDSHAALRIPEFTVAEGTPGQLCQSSL